ncbi:HAD family hydrolase [Dickeya oryzae]
MMEKACLSDYLDIMLSNEDVRKGKPDPEIYITAINKLGVLPSECVVVEDNENGIRAALAAGANVLTVDEVTDVNYKNIKNFILKTEGER